MEAEQMTPDDIKRLRELAMAATPGPYYIGSDDAEECGPHANSGLSLVDTGRHEDWPIARLCESASAAWIAATDPTTILALLDALEAQERATADEARDAKRYRWLRERLHAADFEYGEPPIPVVVFRWPRAPISANLDTSVDKAIAELAKER